MPNPRRFDRDVLKNAKDETRTVQYLKIKKELSASGVTLSCRGVNISPANK